MRIASVLAGFLLAWASVASGQQPTPLSPDPQLTPGDAFDVGVADLCIPGYTKSVRNVPAELKRQVYAEYGVTSPGVGSYEVDHVIPLKLGGSNSIKNLWPESKLTSPWNAFVKDRLENRLHELVCSGRLDLKTAQRVIASNWIGAYKRYVGPQPKAMGRPSEDERAETAPEATPAVPGQVWVNTKSGKSGRVHGRSGSQNEGVRALLARVGGRSRPGAARDRLC
ncbi:MAG TPA: HNH endonuclease signature motif containing protein [Chthoniobacterales bacterium]